MHLLGDLHQYREVCVQELGISQDIFKHGPGAPSEEPPQEIKCLLDCTLRKAGYVDANGVLQVDKIPESAKPEGVDLSQCASITDSDPCQQAFLIENCVKDLLPKPNR